MDQLSAYLPIDRWQAIARGEELSDRTYGAALFADVSGFTPLTEALVKELGPKRGAEELTRQLNAIFEALIAEVHCYGGSVITFAGDAITAWFDRDNGRRATACGLAMQAAARRFDAGQTAAAQQIALAMKAAVATGPARRFRVGDPQFQLMDVLAGTTLDRMAVSAKYAQGGEVILAPETSIELRHWVEVAEWRKEAASGLRYAVVSGLTAPVQPAPWPPAAALPPERGRPWLLAPIYEKLCAGQAEFLAEIRPTVTLFLSFTGIDYDEDKTPEEKLDAYLRWAQGIINRYEGALLQIIMGDKGSYIYATFGAPVAHDDDELRALAAALELRTPPPEVDCVHDICIGLSQGRIWSGAYGSSMRRTYGVLGDAVNLAARLMERAQPGQILVTQNMADSVSRSYRCRSLGPLALKGRAEPVPAALVVGKRRTLPSILMPFAQPLVGREPELAELRQLLAQAQQGEGQIVRLEGEEGVGKSHLAAALAAEASANGWRVHVGASQGISQDVAYTPWRQIFRAVFGLDQLRAEADEPAAVAKRQAARTGAILARVNPGWRIRFPLLGDLLGLPIRDNATTAAFDPRLRQEALFGLAVELAQTYVRDNPVLILLEDAHWMDEASKGLTLALSRALAKQPALIVLVHRPARREGALLPELNRLPYYHRLGLGALPPADLAALIVNRLQGPVTSLAISLIQNQAQGNPFFAQELVDALREAGHLVRPADGPWTLADKLVEALREANNLEKEAASGDWRIVPEAQLAAMGLGIPTSIHGTVLSRLDHLPEQDKLTLKVASVIGRVFEVDLLASIHPAFSGRETLQAQLRNLERHGFTQLETPPPHTAYQFIHNITQEVLYDTLLEVQQRALHRAVGAGLEKLRPEAAEQLAYHFIRADARDKALIYLDQSAAKAQHAYANETALHYYAQALALEERWPRRKGQIEALHILGRRDEERSALQTLEAMPGAPAYEVAQLWGQYYEAVSDYAQAQVAVERALAFAYHQVDRLKRATCLARLGLIGFRQGDFEQSKEWYTQALKLFPGQSTSSDEEAKELALVLNGLGSVACEQGNFDEARQYHEAALVLSWTSGNRKGEAEALSNLGATAAVQRRFADALPSYQESMQIRRFIGDRVGEGMCWSNLAQANLMTGNYGQAQESYLEALHIQQSVGNRWEEINAWLGLGILYQELGELTQAQSYLEQGLAISREINDKSGEAYLLSNLGLVARDRGELVQARTILTQGLMLAEAQDNKILVSAFWSYLSTVSWQLGNAARAIEEANTAMEIHQALDQQVYVIDDIATLAAITLSAGDLKQAQDYARRTQSLLDECGGEGPEFPQRDYFIVYQVWAAAGKEEEALAALRSSYRLVMARADKIADLALRQSFLQKVLLNRQIVEAARASRMG